MSTPPPPLPRTNRTSLVPPLVLSGHAASLTPYKSVGSRCTHRAQLQVAACGGAEVLVGCMQRWMDGRLGEQRESTVEQLGAALCNLTYENDANRIRVGEVGGCVALVRLCRHSRSPRVLEQACAAIGNICKKNRTNRTAFGDSGGCEVILMVLRKSPPEATAVQAVRALGNVAMRSEENQLRLAAAGGLKLLLSLVETLSLRGGLAPQSPASAGGTVVHDHEAPPRAGESCTWSTSLWRGSDGSTPRGTGGILGDVQHQESFLALTLSALAAMTAPPLPNPRNRFARVVARSPVGGGAHAR
jgi:hypothetical protein